MKIVVISSAETSAEIRVPLFSTYSPSPTSRSMAMSAPIFARDRRSAASAISSATSLSSSRGKNCHTRLRPSRARAFRSSGWNTTMSAKAP